MRPYSAEVYRVKPIFSTMQRATAPAASSVADYQVLIVEDEYIIANTLELMLQQAGYAIMGIADSVSEALAFIEQQQPDMVLLDIYLKGPETGIDLAKQLEDKGIPFIYVSANDNPGVLDAVKETQSSGYIVKPFREKDVLTTLEISRYRHAHSVEMKLREEKVLQIALTEALSATESWELKMFNAAKLLQPHIPFDLLTIQHQKPETNRCYNFYRVGFDEYQILSLADLQPMTNLSAEQLLTLQRSRPVDEILRYDEKNATDFGQLNPYTGALTKAFRLSSALVMPLTVGPHDTFLITFLSRKPDAYRPTHTNLLERLEQPIVLMLERVLAFAEVARLSEQLQLEKTYLQEEVKTTANFDEIIGQSPALWQVFNQITQVAYTNTTVLVLGESGTGKELIARAIHNLSGRKNKILVKLNCAALPANLIESELFGHEKGAFTGAIDRRIGKFELAQGGTLFLDEIGELPLELQAKLLRVLQEKEIERLGGKTPISIDVRVVAATNRNLEQEVAEGRFRMDLYFRLATFPLLLPPLRERADDIPMLAQFFAHKSAKRIGKAFHGMSDAMMRELLSYRWPGNIRELENVIEQAIIMSDGHHHLQLGRPLVENLFQTPVRSTALNPEDRVSTTQSAFVQDVTQLKLQTERDCILTALKQTNGRIRGSGGAAERLNLKPTTLEYRMEKLGIRKAVIVDPPSSPTD